MTFRNPTLGELAKELDAAAGNKTALHEWIATARTYIATTYPSHLGAFEAALPEPSWHDIPLQTPAEKMIAGMNSQMRHDLQIATVMQKNAQLFSAWKSRLWGAIRAIDRFAEPALVSSPLTSPRQRLLRILHRFHTVALRLDQRRASRPAIGTIADEYDVQDVLFWLLHIEFDNIVREDPVPTTAGGSARIDIGIRDHDIVLEIKMPRDNQSETDVRDALLVDRGLYRKHPHCRELVCFVYDPRHRIKNPTGFESDLTVEAADLPTTTIVRPR